MHINFKFSLAMGCLSLGLTASGALAQAPSPLSPTTDPLRAAVQKAIVGNPELTARINALRAASNAVDVARGAYRPRVDLEARLAHDRNRISSRSPESDGLSNGGVAVNVNQLLWDGLITSNDIKRAGHEKLTREFELQDIIEQTALEATRTYYDVLRFRRLVTLAEDNYVQHKYTFSQVESRFRAGVGRGVDLEQAAARLALAESNLTTEIANLHDVTARFQRIVGEAPTASLPTPAPLTAGLPTDATQALDVALARSPSISATIENLRAVRAVASAREGLFQPRVEARVRSGAGSNFDGVNNQTRDTSAALVLNWNLYNGGADHARVRQQADLVNQAADLRDRACRDVRQTTAIAFNDTRKLAEQLVYLERNTLALEKTRTAYRSQYDIGQRSLLDLLDNENELFTARRALSNAQHDLAIAQARTHAALRQLVPQLGLSPADTGVDLSEAANWAADADAPQRCPVVAVPIIDVDRRALDARAARMAVNTPPLPAAPASPSPAAPARR